VVRSIAMRLANSIRKDRAETVVVKDPGRVLMALTDLFPGFGRGLNTIRGAERTMLQVADFRERATVGTEGADAHIAEGRRTPTLSDTDPLKRAAASPGRRPGP
jgi:hypothetical protein